MRPVLQALVLADKVYEDKSGKKIIAGTFNKVLLNRKAKVAEGHPTDKTKRVLKGGIDAGCPSVYISLTDLVPQVSLTLSFVNVSLNKGVFESTFEITCDDRLATIELVLPLPPLSVFVPEPGTYSLDLVWNGEIIGSHRVIAVDVSETDTDATTTDGEK